MFVLVALLPAGVELLLSKLKEHERDSNRYMYEKLFNFLLNLFLQLLFMPKLWYLECIFRGILNLYYIFCNVLMICSFRNREWFHTKFHLINNKNCALIVFRSMCSLLVCVLFCWISYPLPYTIGWYRSSSRVWLVRNHPWLSQITYGTKLCHKVTIKHFFDIILFIVWAWILLCLLSLKCFLQIWFSFLLNWLNVYKFTISIIFVPF